MSHGYQTVSNMNGEHLQYEEAIRALNKLQSNAAVLREAGRTNDPAVSASKLLLTDKYLKRCGVEVGHGFGSRVVHVTGTKGKGSTCALCESILRRHGYKTGMFTSPHLIHVKERIQIDGVPLTTRLFTKYFWQVYGMLDRNKDDDTDMPSYFKFLTVMAFKVFTEEKVDVSIVEVGIGGEYDCTNTIKGTAVVGISSLGLDHTGILGNSVESIAWQKGGIMKAGSTAWTTSGQPRQALDVLKQRAAEIKCELKEAPSIHDYSVSAETLNPDGPEVKSKNISLAIQLAHSFMSRSNQTTYKLPDKTLEGIKLCEWPGRFQILKRQNCTYYLDGAHTLESIELCARWFSSVDPSVDSRRRILVFNSTGNRNLDGLISPLVGLGFDQAYTTPNVLATAYSPPDFVKVKNREIDLVSRCVEQKRCWDSMAPIEMEVCRSIEDCLTMIRRRNGHSPVSVLVTGSLLLVGTFLSAVNFEYRR